MNGTNWFDEGHAEQRVAESTTRRGHRPSQANCCAMMAWALATANWRTIFRHLSFFCLKNT